MAPFFSEKSLSKGGEKTPSPQYTSAKKSLGTNRVKSWKTSENFKKL